MRLSEELRARTKSASSGFIRLFVKLPRDREEVSILARQMLRAGTPIAAHAREASRARSDAEFCSKLQVLLQEADEVQLWLEHLKEDCGINFPDVGSLHREVGKLIGIFTTMV